MFHTHTATLQVMYVKSKTREITQDRYKRIYGEDNLRSEIMMKLFLLFGES